MNCPDQILDINPASNSDGLVYSSNQLQKLKGSAICHSAKEDVLDKYKT